MEELCHIDQRIAALLSLADALDANYRLAASGALQVEGLPEREANTIHR